MPMQTFLSIDGVGVGKMTKFSQLGTFSKVHAKKKALIGEKYLTERDSLSITQFLGARW